MAAVGGRCYTADAVFVALCLLAVLASLIVVLALAWVTDRPVPTWLLVAGAAVVLVGAASALITLVVRDQSAPIAAAPASSP